MMADIFTKGCTDQAKWSHALSLINHVDARSFWKYDPKVAASYVKAKNQDALDAGGLSPAGAQGSSDVAMLAGGEIFAFVAIGDQCRHRSDVIRRQRPWSGRTQRSRQCRREQPETW